MKKALAMAAALSLILTLASCAEKNPDSDITTTTEAAVTTTSAEAEKTTTQSEKTTEETTTEEQTTTTTTAKATTTKKTTATKKTTTTKKPSTTKKTTAKKKPSTTKKTTTTKKPSTTKKTPAKPSTKAEIAKAYNAAVNKAISSKAGFTKKVTNSEVEAELGLLNKYKNDIFGFLRVGSNAPETKPKGQNNEKLDLQKASLTAADIKESTCKIENKKWVINMTLNSGTTVSGSTAAAPVDKTGIFIGEKDKKHIDHKTAENYKYAIDNVKIGSIKIASVKSVTEKTSNVKVKAVINPTNGKPESITVSFDSSAHFTKLKTPVKSYDVLDASISSEIKYTSFKW